MAIIYKCRHCSHVIGEMEVQVVATSVLGWNRLSAQDRAKMIQYRENGDVHVKAICENCEAALLEHPSYYELDYFIH